MTSVQFYPEIYNPDCTDCKMHRGAEVVCDRGYGLHNADIIVVSKMPNSDRFQHALEQDLAEVGVDLKRVWWATALKCQNFEANASNADVKKCQHYLDQELDLVRPKFVLALGNEALLATTGHSGIMKYRGRVNDRGVHDKQDREMIRHVFPTISPAMVLARPQNRPAYMAELKAFASLVNGDRADNIQKIKPFNVTNESDLARLIVNLRSAKALAFDIETNIVPLHEFDPAARMISLSGTYVTDGDKIRGFTIPLYHPESSFRTKWKAVVKFVTPVMAAVPIRIAHNGKFDCRWLRKFSGCMIDITFDTMQAVHILDENQVKALKPQCQMRLGVAPWGIDTRALLDMPLAEVLEYNFLDTFYDFLLYRQVRAELIEQPRLLRIFQKLIMPAANNLITAEGHGVWLDTDRLRDRTPIAQKKLDDIEDQIKRFIPERESCSTWPTNKAGRQVDINLNASIFARWLLFDHLGLPVVARGKEKPDGSPGDPSMAEDVLLALNERSDCHPVVQSMLDRVGWQKAMSSFFGPYSTLHDSDQRVHTSFKLHGTVTGRLSSGKEDTSRLSGKISAVKGINLQQVPRDPFIRGLFGATPGWTWVEADFSQIELRIAAMIAHERHMLRLYMTDEDIHMITTMAVTGLPRHKITKEIRKKVGKPVNFGFLYGMGWSKFIMTAFTNYGVRFSEAEAKGYRSRYFDLYPDLIPWHERQRRIVAHQGRVQSPIGRVRHLPDINSPEKGIRAEAERQAINSPVQGLASDMALAGMNLFVQKLREEDLSDRVHVLGLVHDAINMEAQDAVAGRAMILLKESMEDMGNMKRKFALDVTVPIVADIKVGRHWGDSVELTKEQVYDFKSLDTLIAA